jgi:hypothetical protein
MAFHATRFQIYVYLHIRVISCTESTYVDEQVSFLLVRLYVTCCQPFNELHWSVIFGEPAVNVCFVLWVHVDVEFSGVHFDIRKVIWLMVVIMRCSTGFCHGNFHSDRDPFQYIIHIILPFDIKSKILAAPLHKP